MIVRNTMNMLAGARSHGQAIPAFNTFNYEIMKGIHDAAIRLNAPVIMETEYSSMAFCPPEIQAEMARALCNGDLLPIGLHLDHCTEVEMTYRAMRSGYSSVMFDGSALDYDENVRLTREVAQMGHTFGVVVEGELGIIGNEKHTDPALARDFVKKTGIDCLAASVGTAHGLYKEAPQLNFDLIEQLAKTSGALTVLHGGTGVPFEDVKRAIRLGITKVNVGTALRRGFVDTVSETAAKGYVEARDMLEAGVERVSEVCAEWIEICRAAG